MRCRALFCPFGRVVWHPLGRSTEHPLHNRCCPKLGVRNRGTSRTPQLLHHFLLNYRYANSSISLPSVSPREAVDTPHRVRLFCAADSTAGKLPRKKLFEAHGISKSTAYHILHSELARRSDSVHKRGRKPILASYKHDTVEAVEDGCFRFTASYYANISAISLANSSERAI
jgi:hypothetical protein